jgi:FSR family fosmidomycin resistance protein-like MFS transporter
MGRARQLTVLSMGHLVNDLYGTVLPPLYPILMRLYGLSYSLVGVYAAAYLISSAILQPFFGHVFDRLRPRAMLPLSVLIGGLGVGLLGLVRNYGLSLLCTAAAGTGSAIFHPVASAYSSYESRRRGLYFSIFMIAGRVGALSAPFLILFLVGALGFEGLLLLIIPALALQYFLLKVESGEQVMPNGAGETGQEPLTRPSVRSVAVLTGLVAVGGVGAHVAANGVTSFISLLSVSRGLGQEFGGLLLTVHFFGAILGVPVFGWLSDVRGRYVVTLLVIGLASSLLTLLPIVDPIWMLLIVTFQGACFVSMTTLLILIMHEIMPERKGLATSIIYGVALGGGGLSTPLIGYVIDLGGFFTGYLVLALTGLISVAPLALVWRIRSRMAR